MDNARPRFRFVGFCPLLVRAWIWLWARYRLAATAGIADDLMVTVVRLEHPSRWVLTVSGRLRRGAPLVIRASDAHVLDALGVAVDLFVRRAALGSGGARSLVCVSTVLETREG